VVGWRCVPPVVFQRDTFVLVILSGVKDLAHVADVTLGRQRAPSPLERSLTAFGMTNATRCESARASWVLNRHCWVGKEVPKTGHTSLAFGLYKTVSANGG
jgi:hypothetical protein